MNHQPAAVHAFRLEKRAHEAAVAVVAHGRDDPNADAQTGQSGRDVGRESSGVFVEPLDVLEPGLELHRVQIDAGPSHHDRFQRSRHRLPCVEKNGT